MPRYTKETAPQVLALRAGKEFEKWFAAETRMVPGIIFQRLIDVNRNRQPCDYFVVAPNVTLFLELKSTGKDELPLIDVKDHQMESIAFMDGSSPSTKAGVVVQFRNTPSNEVWYIPGKVFSNYINEPHHGLYFSRDYMEEHGFIHTGGRPLPEHSKGWILRGSCRSCESEGGRRPPLWLLWEMYQKQL